MRLQVIRYCADFDYHLCRDAAGEEHRVDLMVSGCLPAQTTPQDLVGHVVEVDELTPYISIACRVRAVIEHPQETAA